MKHIMKKTLGIILVLAVILTGISGTKTQAATAKPTIGCSQATIRNNSCTVKKGSKVKLDAKSGKKDITKKSIWKSSKKMWLLSAKKAYLLQKTPELHMLR